MNLKHGPMEYAAIALRLLTLKIWASLILFRTWRVRMLQERVRRRLSRKLRSGERLKVLFIDCEVAKWKMQSLFSAMKDDARFSPVIGLSCRGGEEECPSPTIAEGMRKAKSYFEGLGDETVDVFDAKDKTYADLEELHPDIVFYQQPWNNFKTLDPEKVAAFALTCYVPYFVPNYGILSLDCGLPFHRFLSLNFTLNDDLAKEYSKMSSGWARAGRFAAVGHPMLDAYLRDDAETGSGNRKIVIFAPHFSIAYKGVCCTKVRYSTFLETGRPILEYAKSHREFHWIFKPHPSLKFALRRLGAWSEEEIEEYYSAWADIGEVVLDGEYIPLFKRSAALITDCGSFLSEYGASGHPVIHLISSENTAVPPKPMADLYDTYYKVRDLEEMREAFKVVLEQGSDPLMEVRLNALKRASLVGENAARNILACLCGYLGGRCE